MYTYIYIYVHINNASFKALAICTYLTIIIVSIVTHKIDCILLYILAPTQLVGREVRVIPCCKVVVPLQFHHIDRHPQPQLHHALNAHLPIRCQNPAHNHPQARVQMMHEKVVTFAWLISATV